MSDKIWDETPLGNTYAHDAIAQLHNSGVIYLDDIYETLLMERGYDIETTAAVAATSYIVNYVINNLSSEEDVPMKLTQAIENNDISFEDYAMDSIVALGLILESELSAYWQSEGEELHSLWVQQIKTVRDGLLEWFENTPPASDETSGSASIDVDEEHHNFIPTLGFI